LASSLGENPSTNPHNDYLLIAMQLGVIGLGLFLYLLWLQWHLAPALPPEYEPLARGWVLTFAMGSLFNSLLFDFTEGHLFAYLGAVLYATYHPSENSPGPAP
jgi:O-antigen ligase